jgi:hypothetical protein
LDGLVAVGARSWCAHGEEGETVRTDRASEDAGEIAVEPTFGDKFLHRALQPVGAVALTETLLKQRFQDAGGAVGMVPDEVLGIELRPVPFKDAVVGFKVAPHLRPWMGGDDGDLRDVEFERGQGAKIFGDGFGSFRRQADDVVAMGVETMAIETFDKLENGLPRKFSSLGI